MYLALAIRRCIETRSTRNSFVGRFRAGNFRSQVITVQYRTLCKTLDWVWTVHCDTVRTAENAVLWQSGGFTGIRKTARILACLSRSKRIQLGVHDTWMHSLNGCYRMAVTMSNECQVDYYWWLNATLISR